MFSDRTNYPHNFDEFAKQNNLQFPPAQCSVYSTTLDKFVQCVKATGKAYPADQAGGDLTHYLDVLTHLKMKDQCRLEYKTYGDRSYGSMPMIPLNNIIIDKSPEGAWEAVLLFLLGNQFNLTRHAGYSQLCIVSCWQKFYNGRPADEVSGKSVCAEADMKTLSAWDITPKVEINSDETATVYCCVFNAWHGFKQISQRVHFDSGTLEDCITLAHVPYCCRVMF